PDFQILRKSLAYLLALVAVFGLLGQDAFVTVTKIPKLIAEGMLLLSGIGFFFYKRFRVTSGTQLAYVVFFFALNCAFVLSCFNAVTAVDAEHLMLGYRGTLICFYGYF